MNSKARLNKLEERTRPPAERVKLGTIICPPDPTAEEQKEYERLLAEAEAEGTHILTVISHANFRGVARVGGGVE